MSRSLTYVLRARPACSERRSRPASDSVAAQPLAQMLTPWKMFLSHPCQSSCLSSLRMGHSIFQPFTFGTCGLNTNLGIIFHLTTHTDIYILNEEKNEIATSKSYLTLRPGMAPGNLFFNIHQILTIFGVNNLYTKVNKKWRHFSNFVPGCHGNQGKIAQPC